MDRSRGMRGVRYKRRAADVGAVEEIGRQVHVIAEADDAHPAHTHAGGADAVDVLDGQAGVVERTARALGHNLKHALVGRVTGGMLVNANDCGLAAETHGGAPYLSSARNLSMAALTSAGFSVVRLWAASAITSSRAPRMRLLMNSACAGGVVTSSRPARI